MSRFVGFQRSGDQLEVEFGEVEREVLDWLAVELAALLRDGAGTPDDAAILDRLLPSAYPDDEEAGREFAGFTRDRISDAKRERIEAVLADLGDTLEGGARRLTLSADRGAIWAQALTDLRLSLAERTGIAAGRRAPRSVADVYEWLGALQWSLVDALGEAASA